MIVVERKVGTRFRYKKHCDGRIMYEGADGQAYFMYEVEPLRDKLSLEALARRDLLV